MKKIFTLLLVLCSLASFSQSLVISQVYGGGGNSGATYKNDFVELFNPTTAAINVNNWSVQYNSATSTTTTWQKTKLPNVSIQPGQYFLIHMAAGSGGTVDLPTADVVGLTAMSGTNGKLVLVSDTNAIAIACPTTNVVDKVGYGTATCFEGAAAPTFGSNLNALFRANDGCTDTNSNTADFAAAPAAPRNTSSPLRNCNGAATPVITATPTSLANFGSVLVGANSTSASFSITGSNLGGAPGNITVAAPDANFQVSLDNSTWSASVSVPFATATLAATTVYVRFTPQSTGALSGNVSISGGGVSTAVTVAVSGTGLAALLPTLSSTSLNSFGNVCLNASAGPNSFTISGANLTTADVTVGPLAGYTFSTTATGSYTAALTLPQAGGSFSQQVFVTFSPTALQSYNGNIPVAGGGAATANNVAAVGAGFNSTPTETTGPATGITAFAATLPGAITGNGCSAVTAYGIEYSTVNGFVNGTVVPANNLATGNFSVSVTGLLPSTTYFYKAYATNAGGTSYGFQSSFTTLSCVPPTVVTLPAVALTITAAMPVGTVTDSGCRAVTAFGIEYSTVPGFPRGFVTRAAGIIEQSKFYVPLTGLVPDSKYYFRTFATNQGGTAFGAVDSFTTKKVAPGLTIYGNGVAPGSQLHFTLGNLYRGYYGVNLYTAAGQLLLHKDLGTQVGFLDVYIPIPASLGQGVYILKINSNNNFTTQARIVVM